MSLLPEPLRIPAFRYFWFARLSTTIGQMAMVIVIGWQVYDIARETMGLKEAAPRLGIIGVVQFVPLFLLTLVTGWTADRDALGAAVVRMALRVWDGPARHGGLALLRSAVGNEWTARLLREFLVSKVLRRVVATLGFDADERAARASLVASQLIGMVMVRYVLRLEPLASASPESVVAALGPTVQRYLTGDVVLPAP